MAATISVHRHGEVTYDDAINELYDVVEEHHNPEVLQELLNCISKHLYSFIEAARYNLGIAEGDGTFMVAKPHHWKEGGFNACIPMKVTSSTFNGKIILRFPIAYTHAENAFPGTVDEKIRSEVAAYAWAGENCQDIRIPRLYGFGLSHCQVRCYTLHSILVMILTVHCSSTPLGALLLSTDDFFAMCNGSFIASSICPC